MEVLADVARLFHLFKEFARDDPLFQRSEANARRHVLQRQQQIAQVVFAVPVGRDVDARQNDLARAAGRRLGVHAFHAPRTRAAAQIGNETVRTEAVAPVLNAQICARVRPLGGGKFAKRGLRLQKDTLFAQKIQNSVLAHRPGDEGDPLPGSKGLRRILRSAAAHEHGRLRIEFAQPCHRLPALFFRFRRDGAGVDDVQVGGAGRIGRLPAARLQPCKQGSALRLVDLAAEGQDTGLHPSSPASCMTTESSAIAAVSARRMRFPSETPQ